MRKTLPLLVAALLASGPAFAAGDWTGWYVGGQLGHSNGSSDIDATLGGAWSGESQALRDHVTGELSRDLDPTGTSHGIYFGYNHQFPSNFVLGGEVAWTQNDADETLNTGPTPTPPFPSLTYDVTSRASIDDQLSARIRAGFASGPHLFFASVGYTEVKVGGFVQIISNGNYRKAGATSERVDGVEYGLGYEYDFGNQWSLRLDYTRSDLDDISFNTIYLPGSAFVTPAYTESLTHDADFDAFRVGVSFRF